MKSFKEFISEEEQAPREHRVVSRYGEYHVERKQPLTGWWPVSRHKTENAANQKMKSLTKKPVDKVSG